MTRPGPRVLWTPPETLRGRLVVAFSALVTCFSVFMTVYVPRQVERQAMASARARAVSLARTAAYTAAAGVYFGDAAALQETVAAVSSDTTVRYVRIVDATGAALASAGASLPSSDRRRPGTDVDRGTLRTVAPVSFRGARIGEVQVGLSLVDVRREVMGSRIGAAASSLLLLIIGVAWVLVMSSLISGPVAQVAEAAKQVAAGDLKRRVTPGGGGEVARLGVAFNAMVDRLQAAQESLAGINRDLEARVRQRTEALEREVEERRRTELALRESEQRFRGIFQTSVVGVAVFDAAGHILDANPALHRMWGALPGRLIGVPFHSLFDGGDRTVVGELVEALGASKREEARVEVAAALAGGGHGTRDVSLGTVRSATGTFVFGFAVIQDTTEQRNLEQRLLQSQKMEAVGRLAGGIAHDFNNLLTVINGSAALALADNDPALPVDRELEEILGAGERAASLTRQLLAFGRRQVMRPRVLQLNEVVRETSSLLRRLIGEDIGLTLRLGDATPPVLADGSQLSQVLINLVVNARDAMPHGGEITIETSAVEVDEDEAARLGMEQDGPHALLRVRDTGVGMDEATQRMIFEPFFTTKPAGQGTGLGLATVYGIVRQSGGAITVSSAPGAGATFDLLLGATVAEDARPAAPRRSEAEVLPARGHETILLVEDEPAVRQFLLKILTRAGYRVLEACNGTDGIRVAGAHDGPIDAVLTDVIMPEMGGPAMVERISADRADVRVIYMSGYTASEILPRPDPTGRVRFLQKPASPREVAAAVRELLDAGAGTSSDLAST